MSLFARTAAPAPSLPRRRARWARLVVASLTGALALGSSLPTVAAAPATRQEGQLEAPDPAYVPGDAPEGATVDPDSVTDPDPVVIDPVDVGVELPDPTANVVVDTPVVPTVTPLGAATANGTSEVVDETFTPTSHNVERADGTGTLEMTANPQWFEDDDGEWQEIDLSLVENPDGEVTPVAAEDPVRFGEDADGAVLTLPIEDGVVAVSYPGADPAADADIDEDASSVAYEDALPGGGDLVLTPTPDGVKEEVVLHDAAQPGSYRSHVVLEPGTRAEQVENGVEFVGADGTVVARVTDGWAFDQTEAFPGPVHVTVVEQTGDAAVLETAVDPTWLADPARVYPVVVDPNWVTSNVVEAESVYNGRDTYITNYQCTTANADQAELWVGTLALAAACDGAGQLAKSRILLRFAMDSHMTFALGVQKVLSMTFTVRNFGGTQNSGNQTYRLYEVTSDWNAGVTWNTKPTTAASELASLSAGPADAPWTFNSTPAMVTLAQKWFDGGPNRGVQLQAAVESNVNTWRRIRGGYNNPVLGTQPKMEIKYLVAPTGVAATAGPAGAIVSWNSSSSDQSIQGWRIQPYDSATGQALPVITPSCVTDCPAQFIGGLTPDRFYRFKIWAVNGTVDGPAAWTAPVKATMPYDVRKRTAAMTGTSVTCAQPAPSSGYLTGQSVGYCVDIANLTDSTRTVRSVVDTLPAGLVLDPASVRVNGAACTGSTTPSCTSTGSTLTVSSFGIPTSTPRAVSYRATVGTTAGCQALVNQVQVQDDPSSAVIEATAPIMGCGAAELSGLGREPWWSFEARSLGPAATASVNVGTGNLVIQQDDSTSIQGHGRQAFQVRRTYNSNEPTSIGLLNDNLGRGWNFAFSAAGDLGAGLASGLVVPDTVSSLLTGSVTLVDRDGTRHVYEQTGTSVNAQIGTSNGTSTFSLDPSILVQSLLGGGGGTILSDLWTAAKRLADPVVNADLSNLTLPSLAICIDTAYERPAGVHTDLWRFIAIKADLDPGTQECAATRTASSGPGGDLPLVLGYATMRPDRVHQVFSITGQLMSEFDATGNELRYVYVSELTEALGLPLGRLAMVYEPEACPTSTPLSSTCRGTRFSYVDNVTTVTDAAGRRTEYTLSPTTDLLTGVRTTDPSGNELARWEYSYQSSSNNCGGRTGQLCTVRDPRNNITQFHYDSDGRVHDIVERRSTSDIDSPSIQAMTSTFDYTTTTTNTTPPVTYISRTDVVRDTQARRYDQIDVLHRVHEVVVAAPNQFGVADVSHLQWEWDGCSTAPEPDNNLCREVRYGGAIPLSESVPRPPGDHTPPNQETIWQYNAQGQVTSQVRDPNGLALTTTNTYAAQSWSPTGLAGPTDPVLFVVSDLISTTSPRNVVTNYVLDRNGSVPVGTLAATCGAGAGNTGLVCEERVTTAAGYTGTDAQPTMDTTPYVTKHTYDSTYGQRLTTTAPDQGITRYAYYADSTKDLGNRTSAGGWLRTVTDDQNGVVVFAYDAAGNVARTWDRDATAANAVDPDGTGPQRAWSIGEYPASGNGVPPRYTETLYSVTNIAPVKWTRPWRWVTTEVDQLGNVTTHQRDANGNEVATTSPAGRQRTATYTARDQLATSSVPATGTTAADTPASTWTYRYDGNANQTSITDPRGHHRLRRFDAAGRPIEERFTRGGHLGGPLATCGPATTADAPLITSGEVCSTKTAYDATGQVVAVTNAAGETTWTDHDGVGRVVATHTPHTTGVWFTARRVLDAGGTVLVDCNARQAVDPDPPVPCGPDARYATHYRYDPLNRVTQQTRYREISSYDDGNELTDADGEMQTVQFDSLVTLTDYTFGNHQQIVTTTTPNGTTSTTVIDSLGRRESMTKPRAVDYNLAPGAVPPDVVSVWDYSPSGDLLTQTQRSGADVASRTSYSYDAAHRPIDTVEAATDDRAASTPSLLAVSGPTPANLRTRKLYDADGLVVGTYDARAFTASTTDPDERYLTRVDYDSRGRATTRWTPYYDTNAATLLSANADEAAECATAGATPAHTPATVAGVPAFPTGVGVCVDRVRYDQNDNIARISNPTAETQSARFTTYTYTDDNLVSTVTAPNPSGATATIETVQRQYDGVGRATVVSTPTVDASGNVVRWEARTTWTGSGLVASTSSGLAGSTPEHVREFAYNAAGQEIGQVEALDGSNHYDAERTRYYADGKVYETSPVDLGVPPAPGEPYVALVDLAVEGDDADLAITRYAYDRNGNAIRIWSPSAVAHADNNDGGIASVNHYSADDLLAATIDPVKADGTSRRLTAYSYDAAGRKTIESTAMVGATTAATNDPNRSSLLFDYADNGWLRVESGRMTGGIRPTIVHNYDPAGHELSVIDSNTTTAAIVTNTWFLNGWLRTSGTTQSGQASYYTGYRYYGDGLEAVRMFSSTANFSATEAFQGYVYDDARTLTSAFNWGWNHDWELWTYANDVAGRPTQLTGPEGRVEAWRRNTDGTVKSSVVTSGSTTVDSWTYEYDRRNRITSRIRGGSASAGVSYGYGYDAAGRVDTYTSGQGTQAITYDPNGNRTQYAGTTYTYQADNSISSAGSATYSYTPFGGVETQGCTTNTYDAFDRLRQVTKTSASGCTAGTTTYTYDGLGRQTTTSTTGTTTEAHQFRYVGTSSTIWNDDNLSGTADDARYITVPNGDAVAVLEGSTNLRRRLHTDGQGNVTLLADTSVAACVRSYDPWGDTDTTAPGTACADTAAAPVAGNAGTNSTIWYRGARQDGVTGDYQFGARTYDPSTASWLQPDTGATTGTPTDLSIGTDPLTANRYSYVNGDPLNLVDPSGHGPTEDDALCRAEGLSDCGAFVSRRVAERRGAQARADAALYMKAYAEIVAEGDRGLPAATDFIDDDVFTPQFFDRLVGFLCRFSATACAEAQRIRDQAQSNYEFSQSLLPEPYRGHAEHARCPFGKVVAEGVGCYFRDPDPEDGGSPLRGAFTHVMEILGDFGHELHEPICTAAATLGYRSAIDATLALMQGDRPGRDDVMGAELTIAEGVAARIGGEVAEDSALHVLGQSTAKLFGPEVGVVATLVDYALC